MSETNEKREFLSTALEKGVAMIHLDARRTGVSVPEHLRGEAHLRLNLSYRFHPADLSVTDWGIRSTLSFSGTLFTVAVPWSAVFAVSSQASRELLAMFPEDMPPEVLQPMRQRVPSAQGSPEPTEGEEPGAQTGATRRGHLRVVN